MDVDGHIMTLSVELERHNLIITEWEAEKAMTINDRKWPRSRKNSPSGKGLGRRPSLVRQRAQSLSSTDRPVFPTGLVSHDSKGSLDAVNNLPKIIVEQLSGSNFGERKLRSSRKPPAVPREDAPKAVGPRGRSGHRGADPNEEDEEDSESRSLVSCRVSEERPLAPLPSSAGHRRASHPNRDKGEESGFEEDDEDYDDSADGMHAFFLSIAVGQTHTECDFFS